MHDSGAIVTSSNSEGETLKVGVGLLTLAPGSGGAETYVRGLLGEFARLHSDVRITVVGNRRLGSAYSEYWGRRISFVAVRSPVSGGRRLTRALGTVLLAGAGRQTRRWFPTDVEVVHFPATVPIPSFNGPTVVTVHDLIHHELPTLWGRTERLYRACAYDRAATSAAVVVTPSEHTKRRLVETLRIEPAKIHVIPWGLDSQRLSGWEPEDERRVLAQFGLPHRFLLYPAALWAHKNHLRLLDALAVLKDREIGLVLTGHPRGRAATVLSHARGRGLWDRVRYLGLVNELALGVLYRHAEALVFPSLAEGFGFPLLEAMTAGCPVVSSDRGPLREVGGTAALFFDPEDPEAIAGTLDRCLSDRALRAELRQAGHSRVRVYSWERAAAAHVDAYASARDLGRDGGAGPRSILAP